MHGQLENLRSHVTQADVDLFLGKFDGKRIEDCSGSGEGQVELGLTSSGKPKGSGAPATSIGDKGSSM